MNFDIIDPLPPQHVQVEFAESESVSHLWFHFRNILAETLHFNVKLIGSDGHVKANRIILATFSPLFKLLLMTETNHVCGVQEILLPDFSVEEISRLLEIIYAGEMICKNEKEVWRLKDLMSVVGIQNGRFTLENIVAVSNGNTSDMDDDCMIIDEENPQFEKQVAPEFEKQVAPEFEKQVAPELEKQVAPEFEKQGVSSHSERSNAGSDVITVIDPDEIVHGYVWEVDNRGQYYECPICTQRYIRKVDAERHFHTIHDKSSLQWIFMGSSVSDEEMSEMEFKCSTCSEMFEFESMLVVHSLLHKSTFPLPCSLCSVTIRRQPDLIGHVQHHLLELQSVTCSFCKQIFRGISKTNLHIRSKHMSDNKRKGFSFLKKSSKTKINLPKIANPPKSISPCVIPAGRGNFYSCSLCAKKFSKHSFMIVHEEEHKGTYPRKCPLCKSSKEFGSRPQLLFHIRTHTAEPRYICSICKKLFFTKASLMEHKNNQHHVKDTIYVICDDSDENTSDVEKSNVDVDSILKDKEESIIGV